MKKLNSRGFSAVEIVIVIIIVGLIGAVGWLVNDRQKTNKTMGQSATHVDAKKTPETPTKANEGKKSIDATAQWLKYTSQNRKYSLSIPDGWELNSLQGADDLEAWTSSKIIFAEGKIAKVDVVQGGRDGSSIAFWVIYNFKGDESSYVSSGLNKVKTYNTDNQVAVNKYTRMQTQEPEGMDIPRGATEYKYSLSFNNKKIQITHDVLSGETDQSSRIEQMIETLKFL